MKIRAVTIGLTLTADDCQQPSVLHDKLKFAFSHAQAISSKLQKAGYSVQTVRIALNSFEEWILPVLEAGLFTLEDVILTLESTLVTLGIDFCSIGAARSLKGIAIIPDLLAGSHVSSSVSLSPSNPSDITCNSLLALKTAEVCLEVAKRCGDNGNFRFAAVFNVPPNTPFFPAAYHSSLSSSSIVTIGLENGDLVFLGCHAARDHGRAREVLTDVFTQAYLPIQSIVSQACDSLGILYGGIDASINPGLGFPDSVGKGIEDLLATQADTSPHTQTRTQACFGHAGTLAAVATLTTAIKALATTELKLAGYCGLMLPVMEDVVLAARAAEATFSLCDLLTFSSVCGVGLDTIPIPGDTAPPVIAAVYADVCAMAYRLCKPLSCRLLPMDGLRAGEWTRIRDSLYLTNTKVFPVT
jgi:uncharacterized protein (UPF0210 family)